MLEEAIVIKDGDRLDERRQRKQEEWGYVKAYRTTWQKRGWKNVLDVNFPGNVDGCRKGHPRQLWTEPSARLLRLFKKSTKFDSEFSHNGCLGSFRRFLIPRFSRGRRTIFCSAIVFVASSNVFAMELQKLGNTEPFMPIVLDKVFKASLLNCFEITVAPGSVIKFETWGSLKKKKKKKKKWRKKERWKKNCITR